MFHPLRPRFDEVRHRAVEIGCRFDKPVGARTQAGANRTNKTKGIFRHRQREGERPRLQSDRETETGSEGMLRTRKSAHEAAFPLRDDAAEGERVLACAVRKSECKFRVHRIGLCLWIELLVFVLLENASFDHLVDELLHGVHGAEEALRRHDHADVRDRGRGFAFASGLKGDEVKTDHVAGEVDLTDAVCEDFFFVCHSGNSLCRFFVLFLVSFGDEKQKRDILSDSDRTGRTGGMNPGMLQKLDILYLMFPKKASPFLTFF